MIREDWEVCIVEDVLELMKNGSSAKQYNENVGFPITRIETIWNEQIDLERVKYIRENDVDLISKHGIKYGDILFSHINSDSHLGKTAIYKFQDKTVIHGINLLLLRPVRNINADFLNYQFKYLRIKGRFIDEAQRAVNQSSINQRKLKKIPIVVAPLPEQRAIVAKIEELFSELDSGIASLKKAKEQLEVYRQAVLKAAFEGKLTRGWRKENKNLCNTNDLLEKIEEERTNYYESLIKKWEDEVREWEKGNKEEKKPSKPRKISEINHVDDNEKLNDLPNSWDWTRLSNLVLDASKDIVDGPFGSNLKSTEYVDEGYPVLRIQNIKANKFINKNFRYISVEKYNVLSRHKFKPNDLVVTKLGNPLGLTCRVPSYMGEGVIVADLIRISPSLKNINYDWLTYLLNSEVIQAQFREITKGTTRPRMNLTIMRDTLVPICPIEEQNQIVQEIESRLSVCENIEATIEEALEKSEALRQSILKKAFEGKLLSNEELEACRRESDWEPAKELLKRIKEDKKGAKSNG
ncbi:MAG: restriction endonuclease subunit S [Acutalibacteraceae bacterium]|jgi:type I restriction enzyme S subunit